MIDGSKLLGPWFEFDRAGMRFRGRKNGSIWEFERSDRGEWVPVRTTGSREGCMLDMMSAMYDHATQFGPVAISPRDHFTTGAKTMRDTIALSLSVAGAHALAESVHRVDVPPYRIDSNRDPRS